MNASRTDLPAWVATILDVAATLAGELGRDPWPKEIAYAAGKDVGTVRDARALAMKYHPSFWPWGWQQGHPQPQQAAPRMVLPDEAEDPGGFAAPDVSIAPDAPDDLADASAAIAAAQVEIAMARLVLETLRPLGRAGAVRVLEQLAERIGAGDGRSEGETGRGKEGGGV